MAGDTNPGNYNLPGTAQALGATPVSPAPVTQVTKANLAPGGIFDMDFNIDANPILDVMLFADQIIGVAIFLRDASTSPWRLLDGAVFAVGVAGTMKQPIRGLRLAGSQARVEFQNNTLVATTTMLGQATFRGF